MKKAPKTDTLLSKALAVPRPARRAGWVPDDVIRQRIELARAFCRGDVTSSQSATALGLRAGSTTTVLGQALFAGLRRGLIRVEYARKRGGDE